MKKSIKRAAAFVLAMLLCTASAALADFKRGDSGEEVAELQQLLFESGWLFESPDGKFGKNTEAAVKDFEEYAGLPVDGIADDRMIYELAVAHDALSEEADIADENSEAHVSGYAIGETSESPEAFVLNSSVIIDGQMIYYAGEPEGEGHGVYAMYADGSDRIKLADIKATLKAASNGNLLLWHYDDNGYAALEVLRMDGSLEPVGYGNAHAIAKDGRFYFGGSSVAEDGSDHQWLLSSDPEYHDNYYPVDVADGYLYYLDANGGSVAYTEGNALPSGDVELNRLNLETGEIELLSGAGTCYLGIEGGALYYTREDFEIYDYESDNAFTLEVDEGLYSMRLDAPAETKIAELSDDPLIFEYYMFIEDGVVYGEYSDYNPDEAIYKVLRRKVNGGELPALELDAEDTGVLCAADGVLYGIQTNIIEYDDCYAYEEYLVMYDLAGDSVMRIAMDENEALTYTEVRPRIAVENGRIYFCVQDTTNGAEALKSAALNGDDVITLVKSAPLY